MRFRARRDAYFTKLMCMISLILAGAISLPLLDKDSRTPGVILCIAILLILCVGFIWWLSLDIQYTFHKDHLFVKGGPFKSRIPYQAITKVTHETNMFVGYRILSARNGIEIHYKTGLWGSVQISPENQTQFLTELQIRCPHVVLNKQ